MPNTKDHIDYFEVINYHSFIVNFKDSKNQNIISNHFDDFIFDSDIDKLINKINNQFDSNIFNHLRADFTSNIFNMYIEEKLVNKLFGPSSKNFHSRVYLLPCYVEFNNSFNTWIFPELIVFLNSYMFIKLNIPFKDLTLEHFYENEPHKYFNNFTLANCTRTSFENLEDLIKHYINLIEKHFNATITPIEKDFNHISIIRYDSMYNNDQENVRPKISEIAYRVSKAPTANYNYEYLKKDIDDFFEKQSINHGKITSVLNPYGNCISFVHNYNQQFDDNFKPQENPLLNPHSLLGRISGIDTEYAILMNMLKYINDSTYFKKRLNKDAINLSELSKIRDEYNLNKLLLYQLLESCTEEILKLYQQFESRLYLLHNSSFYSEKSKAIDEMIANNINNQNEKLQNTISFVNLALVTLFGLPTIRETLQIIKNTLNIGDLPYITLNSASVIIWVLCFTISIKLFNFNIHFFKQKS